MNFKNTTQLCIFIMCKAMIAPTSLAGQMVTTQLYEHALTHQKDYQYSLKQLDIAKAGVTLAESALKPRINIESSFGTSKKISPDSPNIRSAAYNISIQQALFYLPARYQYNSVISAKDQATLAVKQAQNGLMIDVATQYFDWLTAKDEHSALEQERKELQLKADQTHDKLKAGVTTELALLQAKTALAAVNARLLMAKQNIKSRQTSLENLTGVKNLPVHQLSANTTLPHLEGQIETWITKAIKNSLIIQIQQKAIEKQVQLVKASQSKRYPTISIGGSISKSNYRPTSMLQTNNTTTGAQINITMPLYDGQQINAEVQQAQLTKEQLELTQTQNIHDLSENIRTLYDTIAVQKSLISAEHSGQKTASKLLQVAEQSLKLGTGTMENVLTALTQQRESKQRLIEAQYRYLLLILQLKFAAGTISKTDLMDIDQLLS